MASVFKKNGKFAVVYDGRLDGRPKGTRAYIYAIKSRKLADQIKVQKDLEEQLYKAKVHKPSPNASKAEAADSAIASLVDWRRIMRRCTFLRLDAFEFLDSVKDQEGHGVYVDANWPDDGDCYKHKISNGCQYKLAERLRSFRKTRVVIRFGVHPLIAELYPRDRWHWLDQSSRAQSNRKVPEALILNGPPMAKEAA